MSLLLEHLRESLSEQELLPGTYIETPVLLSKPEKRKMQAWLQTQGHGSITFWEPAQGGYRLSLHQKSRKLLPAFAKMAERFTVKKG
jgi:hypothetical protein